MKPELAHLSFFSRLSRKFSDSLASLKHPRTIAISGMLIALNVALSMVTIYITPELRLTLSFLAVALSCMMFGPVAGMIVAASGDIFSFLLHPAGPYFPGFTISEVIGALIMGLLFYECALKLRNIIFARAIITLAVNCVLNTIWLSMLYGSAYSVLFWPRVAKNLIMLPIEIFVCFAVLGVCQKLSVRLKTAN